ncbi:hypothetical protein E2C01_022347 [Portunus trituberculatus]|uniref:Uncharacterized protein n=1 Tax=Portunus trituberculatus TaxID=210409 RepID=A0A5B7E717_PORTR|nr:hypothetical protein [Portunus trituberculatus]
MSAARHHFLFKQRVEPSCRRPPVPLLSGTHSHSEKQLNVLHNLHVTRRTDEVLPGARSNSAAIEGAAKHNKAPGYESPVLITEQHQPTPVIPRRTMGSGARWRGGGRLREAMTAETETSKSDRQRARMDGKPTCEDELV